VRREQQPDWPKDPSRLREAVNRETDYIYVPLSYLAEADLLTAFDLPDNHQQDAVNALFADLHVNAIDRPDDFMAAVQKTSDWLAAERGMRR
jgi:prepilin-type processing-associated H-X9-DG protein